MNNQKDLIFALDIGTRSVIGIVGEAKGEMFHVLYMAKQEHSRRAMVDGQIEDIDQVAKVVKIVKERLEEQVGFPLTRVCVAAAGRSLRMERARAVVELPEITTITEELISQLEAVAIADAEEKLSEHNKDQRFYLVGYTVAQYILDRYPMTTIKGHNGQNMEADVVATFLPSQVVEGLYSVVHMADMEVASLTLEPIAALNATIPPDLRLLNLVLVDIGAGTSDIAVCRDGSVVGYTMATTAGDEITEMLMKHFLVDFNTAESLKTNLNAGDLKYVDVLGLEQITSGQQIADAVATASRNLAKEIGKQIFSINGCAPSAVFMAGGGSKLEGITTLLAETLEMQNHRIAIAGNNFSRTVVADNFQLEDPEYATPLGIAVSAALGLINDSYHITLNGKGAKLFRSGSLTILDILMMNGYTAAALIGRTGKNLALMINGNKKIVRGKPSIPGILRLNGEPAVAGGLVSAGDVIEFVPAIDGMSATSTLQELLGDYAGRVLLNGAEAPWDTQLRSGDSITTISTPMHGQKQGRKNRPLSEAEVRPIDAQGNPVDLPSDDVYYNEMLKGRAVPTDADFTLMSDGEMHSATIYQETSALDEFINYDKKAVKEESNRPKPVVGNGPPRMPEIPPSLLSQILPDTVSPPTEVEPPAPVQAPVPEPIPEPISQVPEEDVKIYGSGSTESQIPEPLKQALAPELKASEPKEEAPKSEIASMPDFSGSSMEEKLQAKLDQLEDANELEDVPDLAELSQLPKPPVSPVPSPIEQVPSPIEQVPSPIERVPSPIEQVPSPIEQVPSYAQEKAEEKPEEKDSMLSFLEEPEPPVAPEKKLRDYPTPDEEQVPMPEPVDMTPEPFLEEDLLPVMLMSDDFEEAALKMLGESPTTPPPSMYEEIQKTVGEAVDYMHREEEKHHEQRSSADFAQDDFGNLPPRPSQSETREMPDFSSPVSGISSSYDIPDLMTPTAPPPPPPSPFEPSPIVPVEPKPAPVEPSPVQPSPVEPIAPMQPSQVEPIAPMQPSPVEPIAPMQPSPVEPIAPMQPSPVEPIAPIQPTPTPPAPTPKPISSPVIPPPEPEQSNPNQAPLTEGRIVLNGAPIQLSPKGDGSPYYLMDLLDKTDIDFRQVSKPIRMLVNGKEGYFVQQIHANDDVLIEEQR